MCAPVVHGRFPKAVVPLPVRWHKASFVVVPSSIDTPTPILSFVLASIVAAAAAAVPLFLATTPVSIMLWGLWVKRESKCMYLVCVPSHGTPSNGNQPSLNFGCSVTFILLVRCVKGM